MNKTDKAKGAATKTNDGQFDIKEIYAPLSKGQAASHSHAGGRR